MSPQHLPARPGRTDYLKVLPVPALLTVAHLAGGAGGMVEAGIVTAVLAILCGLAFAGRRLSPGRAYISGLRIPAIAAGVVILLGVLSVTPGSGRLAGGWIADAAGLSTLSVDPEATWVELIKMMGLATVFIIAQRYAATPARLTATLRLLVWMTVGWAGWALVLYAGLGTSGGAAPRLTGTFVSPNVAACALSLGLLCWMSLLAMKASRSGLASRLLMIGAGVMLAGALLLTASRSAIVLMAVLSVCLQAPTAWARLKARLATAALPNVTTLLGAAGLAVLALSAGVFVVRLGALREEAQNRLDIIGAYTEAALANPLLGQGFGAVPRISRLLLSAENDSFLWNVRAVHNLPLQWIIEAGLIGSVAAAIALVALIAIPVRRLAPRNRRQLAPIILVSAFMLGQGLVDYPAQIYSLALTWAFLLGLTYARAFMAAPGGSEIQSEFSPDAEEDVTMPSVSRRGPDDTALPAVRHG